MEITLIIELHDHGGSSHIKTSVNLSSEVQLISFSRNFISNGSNMFFNSGHRSTIEEKISFILADRRRISI